MLLDQTRDPRDRRDALARELLLRIPYPSKRLPEEGNEGNRSFSETLDELDPYLDWDAITRAEMEDCWTAAADEGRIYVFESV